MKWRNTFHICVSHSLLKQHFFSSQSTNGRDHIFSCCQTRHICITHTRTHTPLDHSNNTVPSVKVRSGYVHIHFLLIMSFSCLWLLPDSALGLLISEYIINNLHVISFVLIIFVWRNVSLHGECWGYLPHLEAQGTPCRVCYVALCD